MDNISRKVWMAMVLICGGMILPLRAEGECKRRCMAPTPPMGWNSWNCMGSHINVPILMEMADAMVQSGMKDAGYQYLVIDDVWFYGKVGKHFTQKEDIPGRDADGVLIPDPDIFPNGADSIKFVSEYIHNCGLKFGMYLAPGSATCGGNPGSYGYEKIDIETFASWGVDFIKLDFCGLEPGQTVEGVLSTWRAFLDQIDRPIVLSVNPGPSDYRIVAKYADMWRTTSDITAMWDTPRGDVRKVTIRQIIRQVETLQEFNGVCSGWCDPDMLAVGNGELTEEENRTHFSMWAMFSAPLIAGTDLRFMTESTRTILTNKEVIAVDQDPLGQMAYKVREDKPGLEIWVKPLQPYATLVVAMLNTTDVPAKIRLRWEDLGIRGPAQLRDLWLHKELGEYRGRYVTEVPAHGVVMLKVQAYEDIVPYQFAAMIPENGLLCEAEDLFGHSAIFSQQEGFSGSGYISGKDHTWLCMDMVLNLRVPEDGEYPVEIRYANGSKEPSNFILNLFGDTVESLSFSPTGGWSQWKSMTTKMRLRKGTNLIYLRANSPADSERVGIDWVKIHPQAEK